MLTFAAFLLFLATFAAVAGALLLTRVAVDRAQPAGLAPEAAPSAGALLLRDDSLSTISFWASLLERFDFVDLMRARIEQADLSWSIGRVTFSMLLSGALVFYFLLGRAWIPWWISAALACSASLLPYLYILRRRDKRLAKFQSQFPDALDSLARALRAGHPFAAALDLIAGESEAPISTELRRVSIEGNFGTSWKQALENLARRMPLLEVNMFAAAVQLHSRTGGKLSELIATLAEGMRESEALRGEVNAIAAHGKMTGAVLTVLPLIIALVMSFVNPSYLAVLVSNAYGKYLIIAALACLVAAHFIIRRIVAIKT